MEPRQSGFDHRATPIYRFLQKRTQESAGIARPGGAPLPPLSGLPIDAIAEAWAKRGILSPDVLAEWALRGIDVPAEAHALGISPAQLSSLCDAALEGLEPAAREAIERAVRTTHGTGGFDINHPDYPEFRRRLKLDDIPVVPADEKGASSAERLKAFFAPLGPTKSIDHRASLGTARDQGGRPTCTAFAATAVVESLEYLRDMRAGPRDLSEEQLWWYAKTGELYSAGGYDAGGMLRHYYEYGSCEEAHLPYWGENILANYAHVPVPDTAIDRARFYTQDYLYRLPDGDVNAAKQALSSGKCVAFHSDVDGWNTGTGQITFPVPPESKGRGGGHSTTLIGYVDRADLPALFEGGYFIVRNSWGDGDAASNELGPEYAGHLRMPYGWYRRYTCASYTLADVDAYRWVAEWYDNVSLKGTPRVVTEVGDVDFNWGGNSPIPGTIPADNFSARFSRTRRFRPGWYRFRLTGDDGVRLRVDDRLVISAWKDQGPTEYVCEHYLTGGDHLLVIEYYEHGGGAALRLNVEPVLFHFELFAGPTPAGNPVSTFDDTLTSLEWRHVPPAGSDGQFSLRATAASKRFNAGMYRFHASHTGRCKIWVDNQVVLDDWGGTHHDGDPVNISEGNHAIKVEFCNLAQAPASKGYYRAALKFDWSDAAWRASFYNDQERREKIHKANWPDVDSIYEGLHTQGLTGSPVFECSYAASHNAAGEYHTEEGGRWVFEAEGDRFKKGIPGSDAIPADWVGAHIRRRVFIPKTGCYGIYFLCKDGYRLVVDGRAIAIDPEKLVECEYRTDLELEAGVHDISVEHTTVSGKKLSFRMDPVSWKVDYYRGIHFETPVATQYVDSVGKMIGARPASLGNANYSIRASRRMWLPVGLYRIQVRADDGIRVKVGGKALVDAWLDQPPTAYWATFEHHGGETPIEIEYYQNGGGAALEFSLVPDGFLGEYYRGTTLEKPAPATRLDRNLPVAYRFEPGVCFYWGGSGPYPRIGEDLFSARWRGPVDLPVGRWSVEVEADDGVRLFLDGKLLINEWKITAPATYRRTIDLVGGRHQIRLEYYEQTSGARCRLSFKRIFPVIIN